MLGNLILQRTSKVSQLFVPNGVKMAIVYQKIKSCAAAGEKPPDPRLYDVELHQFAWHNV